MEPRVKIHRNFLILLHDVDISSNICFIYWNLKWPFQNFP